MRKTLNFISSSDFQMERILITAYFNIPIWRCDFVGVLEIKFLTIRLHDIYDFSDNNRCLLIRTINHTKREWLIDFLTDAMALGEKGPQATDKGKKGPPVVE